jgi:hypothetical protein
MAAQLCSSVPRSPLLQEETYNIQALLFVTFTPLPPSFNADVLGPLAPEQELCFITQHIPTAQNLDRVFSTAGNYPTRLHTLPTPKE